ncbi:Aquaporin-7 [Biomphalaria glabrata]
MLIAEEPKDSCQDICGEWRELPCSCDPKCLVFSNCCEDFEVECSGIVEESKSNYAGLEHSEVKCINNIFVITSCSVIATESPNSTSLEDSNKKNKSPNQTT